MQNFDKGCRRALVAAGWKRRDVAGPPPDYKPQERWLDPDGDGLAVSYQTAARRLKKPRRFTKCPRCSIRHRKLPGCYWLLKVEHDHANLGASQCDLDTKTWRAWKQVVSKQWEQMCAYCSRMGWSA